MRFLSYLAIICLFAAISGCLKKAAPGPDKVAKPVPNFVFTPSKNPVITPVTGNWQWIITIGLDGPFTPANTHSTMRLQFNTDSTLSEFRNDTLVLKENYSYIKNYTFFDNSVSDAVEMNQSYSRPTIKNDTLTLDFIVMADPSTAKFVRIK